MKRILSALLAVLCTLALTACGTTPSSSAPPKEESSPESKAQSSQASEPGEEQGSDRETVDLVFYWQGDGKPDNQRVWDKPPANTTTPPMSPQAATPSGCSRAPSQS